MSAGDGGGQWYRQPVRFRRDERVTALRAFLGREQMALAWLLLSCLTAWCAEASSATEAVLRISRPMAQQEARAWGIGDRLFERLVGALVAHQLLEQREEGDLALVDESMVRRVETTEAAGPGGEPRPRNRSHAYRLNHRAEVLEKDRLRKRGRKTTPAPSSATFRDGSATPAVADSVTPDADSATAPSRNVAESEPSPPGSPPSAHARSQAPAPGDLPAAARGLAVVRAETSQEIPAFAAHVAAHASLEAPPASGLRSTRPAPKAPKAPKTSAPAKVSLRADELAEAYGAGVAQVTGTGYALAWASWHYQAIARAIDAHSERRTGSELLAWLTGSVASYVAACRDSSRDADKGYSPDRWAIWLSTGGRSGAPASTSAPARAARVAPPQPRNPEPDAPSPYTPGFSFSPDDTDETLAAKTAPLKLAGGLR